jgi:hypothetical protein
MELVLVSTGLEDRYLAWCWYRHIQTLSVKLSSPFLDTTMLDRLYVLLYHVLCKYYRIDQNIKRVENCLDTTDSSANELNSPADEPIVIR